MRLALADKIAERLINRIKPSGAYVVGGCVAGSVRRRKPEPRDIEILMPWMPPDHDEIYDLIAAMCPPLPDQSQMFGQSAGASDPPWFQVVHGLKPGFRAAQLLCRASTDERWRAANAPDFKIDIFRFETPDRPRGGNFGWVLLQRTGPAEFGEACLAHFKRNGGGGSRDGYLIDGTSGEPIPTRTEIDAFMAMGVAFVEPSERKGRESVRAQTDWHQPVTEEAIPF